MFNFLAEKNPVRDNPQGSNRPCTNLKSVNRFVSVTYFTLAGLREISPYLRSDYYACKVYLKSAYFRRPVSTQDAAWLVFRFSGQLYKWTCLSFGLNVASREWQGMMLPIIDLLGAHGALVWVYLNDFLVIAPSADICRMHTQMVFDLLFKLGIQVHIAKSVLTPTKSLIFLGFWLDLAKARVMIPPVKMQSVINDVNRVLHADLPTCRQYSTIFGRARSLLVAAPRMRIFMDALAIHVAVLIRKGQEATAALPEGVTIQLELILEEF